MKKLIIWLVVLAVFISVLATIVSAYSNHRLWPMVVVQIACLIFVLNAANNILAIQREIKRLEEIRRQLDDADETIKRLAL